MRIEALLAPLLSVALAWPTTVRAAPANPAPASPDAANPAAPPAPANPPAGSETPANPGAAPTHRGDPSEPTVMEEPAPTAPTAAPEAAPPTDASPPAPAAPTAPEAAQETEGDLRATIDAARAEREAQPSATRWHQEGEALERAGRYAEAEVAYAEALDALPAKAKAERTAYANDLERVRLQARGTVASEPTSTHRAALDARWAAEPAAAPPPAAAPEAPPPGPHDRLVNKWYFWVTLGAIAASAVAVTVISVQASRETRTDALSSAGPESGAATGGALFRF